MQTEEHARVPWLSKLHQRVW